MKPDRQNVCSDFISVQLDERLELATLVFALQESSEDVSIRLPAQALITLRDALRDLSEDPVESVARRARLTPFGLTYPQCEEDLGDAWEPDHGEIRRRESRFETA